MKWILELQNSRLFQQGFFFFCEYKYYKNYGLISKSKNSWMTLFICFILMNLWWKVIRWCKSFGQNNHTIVAHDFKVQSEYFHLMSSIKFLNGCHLQMKFPSCKIMQSEKHLVDELYNGTCCRIIDSRAIFSNFGAQFFLFPPFSFFFLDEKLLLSSSKSIT